MLTFAAYSTATTLEEALSPKFFLPKDIAKSISTVKSIDVKKDITFDTKKSSSKRQVFVVRTSDRDSTKSDIHNALKKSRLNFQDKRVSGSGFNSTVIGDVIIMYKPKAGGMGETTINSTITELVPALAFNAGKKFSNAKALYDFVANLDHKKNSAAYVNKADLDAGMKMTELFPTSSKFDEKMNNAVGVLKYLHTLNKETPIDKVVWAYRAKPPGVDPSFKGDLVIYFKNKKMLGVSLKAGGAKTKEPQLNTYVQKILNNMKRKTDIGGLAKKQYDKIYKQLGLPKNYKDRSQRENTYDVLEKLEKEKKREYERLYDISLEMQRDALIDAFNKNMKDTMKHFIYGQVLNKIPGLPLVIVKAVGSSYKMVTDEDDLETFLPQVNKIRAYKSSSSKQDFFIDLISKGETLTMAMVVRTSQSGVGHKLGQFDNLRVIFKGLK